MRKISSILAEILSTHRQIAEATRFDLGALWEKAAGSQIAQVSVPERLSAGILHIVVKDPVWSAQLNLMKREILRKIEESTEPGFIKEIRFRVKSLPRGSLRNRSNP